MSTENQTANATPAPKSLLGNLRETQSVLAYIITIGFLAVEGYALYKAQTFSDVTAVLASIAPLATMVLAFFFANKAAQQAQATASAAQQAQAAASA